MGAIGNYIHLYYKNYKKYGDSKKNSQSVSSEAIMLSQQKQIISENNSSNLALKDKEKKDLENAITILMKGNTNNKEANERANEVWGQVVEYWQDEFNNLTGIIERETGNVINSNNINTAISTIQTKYTGKNKDGVRSISLATILKRARLILESVSKMDNSYADKQELANKINNIFTEISELTSLSEEMLKAQDLNIDSNQEIKGKSYKYYTDSKVKSIVDELNKIIAGSAVASNLQKGTLFEDMIAAAVANLAGTGVEEIKKAIEESVTGGTKYATSVIVDGNLFDSSIDLNKVLGNKYKQIGDNIYSSTIRTQNKVDVEVEYKNKNLLISAKNVNLSSGFDIHLLSGASLLTLLATQNSTFVNHYLNIMAEHNEENDISVELSAEKAATEAVKIILFILGLKGYKEKKANLFIVNDNKTGKVIIVDMNSLINKVSKNIDKYVDISGNGVDISQIHFKNKKASNYSERITNLLSDVHNKKIQVALKPDILSKI